VNGQLHDLGDIALLQAHRLPLQCVPCNLTDIVRGAIDEQRQHTPEQDIHLELPALEAEQQAMQVKADPERIHQVIHYYLILNISAL
jgi:signal transduction histidine kinase